MTLLNVYCIQIQKYKKLIEIKTELYCGLFKTAGCRLISVNVPNPVI